MKRWIRGKKELASGERKSAGWRIWRRKLDGYQALEDKVERARYRAQAQRAGDNKDAYLNVRFPQVTNAVKWPPLPHNQLQQTDTGLQIQCEAAHCFKCHTHSGVFHPNACLRRPNHSKDRSAFFFSISGASWSRSRWGGGASHHPLASAFTRLLLNLRARVWFAPRDSGPVLLKSASLVCQKMFSYVSKSEVKNKKLTLQLLLLQLHFSERLELFIFWAPSRQCGHLFVTRSTDLDRPQYTGGFALVRQSDALFPPPLL